NADAYLVAASPLGSLTVVKAWLAEHSALRFALTRAVHASPRLETTAARLGLVVPNAQDAAESDISDEAIASSAERLHRLIDKRTAIVLVIPSRGLWLGSPEHRQAISRADTAFIGQIRQAGIDVVHVKERIERGG